MSAPTVVRDLVVAHTRMLKLPAWPARLKAWPGKPATATGPTRTICTRSSAPRRLASRVGNPPALARGALPGDSDVDRLTSPPPTASTRRRSTRRQGEGSPPPRMILAVPSATVEHLAMRSGEATKQKRVCCLPGGLIWCDNSSKRAKPAAAAAALRVESHH